MQTLLFLPELSLISMVLVFFFLSIIRPGGKPVSGSLLPIALVMAAISVIASAYTYGKTGNLFFDAYQVDAYSQAFKMLITFGLFLVFYLGNGLNGVDSKLKPEYYMFLSMSAMGLVFLSSSVELLTILLSLEISSFALYIVIPFRKLNNYNKQMEAGIKYVLFGGAATGVSLYGMGYIFGLAHTTYVAELAKVLPGIITTQPLAIIGLVLMLSGFFYKLALFPMHFWAPDVYEGSSNETSSFVATLPKIGAVALLIRLVSLAGADLSQFTWVLATFAVLSMTLGNLSALVQTDIKRLLAYSSIAHAGYIMIGIICGNSTGYEAAIYYIVGYLLMNLACFYVVYNLSENGENLQLDDLKGLYRRSPLLAFVLAAGAFGMAGIPPTIGFMGKFLLFTGALKSGLYALVIISVLNAGVSAFYYLKMVRAAYQPADEEGASVNIGFASAFLGVFLIISILITGTFPSEIVQIAKEAVATIL